MKHYIMNTSQKNLGVDAIDWVEFSDIESVRCEKEDSIWVSTFHKNWRENIIAAS